MAESTNQAPASSEEKRKIRPLYYALQGYLKEAPPYKNTYDILEDKTQYECVNDTINRLNTVTGKNYDNFKIVPPNHAGWGEAVRISAFKGNLGGLINYLHGEYFYDESEPLSGNPSMVINQNQQQSTNIVLALEVQKKIDEKLATTHEEKEKNFLHKLSEQLPNISNGIQLIRQVLDLADQMGLNPHQTSKLFS